MKLEYLAEPKLVFANGEHICPRKGISHYGVFDKTLKNRRSEINLGGVGTARCINLLSAWLDKCSSNIAAVENPKQPNLKLAFSGFNYESGFASTFNFDSGLSRQILKSDIDDLLKIINQKERIEKAIELYFENIKFLAQNRHVDVVVCVIPDKLYKAIATEEQSSDESLEDEQRPKELNFRRALKARTMHLGKPLQLVRDISLESEKSGQQDDATRAWNFCTALYYKSGPTIPWKLAQDISKPSSCAVGIAFYRSRDYQTLNTSLAQIFDELGNGLILRGTPVEINKDDRVPRLTSQQAYDLLSAALNEYRIALGNFPARVVVHKSANFSNEEVDGLTQAAKSMRINIVDFVTVMDSKLRLFRNGNYPPFRGTYVQLDDSRHLLYSRGSVWYYQTYPGQYIPQPLELRIVKSEESPSFIAKELLGLTKMNWNNTQFDGKCPVTIGCARKVGEIMKYLTEYEQPQIRYGYYM
jgi:hypothetical protein